MTDIVERLRDYADGLSGYAADMMGDAADEIERLRREREIFSQALNDANEWGGELYAYNERLREALLDLEQYVSRADHFYLKPETLAALKEGE